MNRRRSGLGSGLDALFSAPAGEQSTALREVPIDQIRPNSRQPRIQFDEAALEELAASIREHGIIQPLVVSEHDGGYELIAGERRWRASQRAGLQQVPVIVREAAPQQILEIALIENVQRADLNALEEARAYQSLVDDFGLSDGEIAKRLGKGSREAIANARRLLHLESQAQEAILKGQISAGHGRAILKLKEEDAQRAMVQVIIESDLSVRAAERLADLIREHNGDTRAALAALRGVSKFAPAAPSEAPQSVPTTPAAVSRPTGLSADDEEIRRALERILSTPVSLARTDKELRVTIAFHTEEKLQEFFDWVNR
ncbi:MAG: ParB/RepB/Spo0J family partition protein [Roseiflexaceae bacterium]|nr:ParB/RepB/Spo0J family partition protein [Roseiflexaceae bacterium]